MPSNLYITATRRGQGKTTITLGVTMALSARIPNLGFIKPIGVRHIERSNLTLDEDTLLIHRACSIHTNIQESSPITIHRGLPFSDATAFDSEKTLARIDEAFEHVSEGKDMVIIMGTGHAAVGSTWGLSNAQLARRFQAKVLLVTTADIGHPLDEIILNQTQFQKEGVELVGAIVNQVPRDQIEHVDRLARESLDTHGIRYLGSLPLIPTLGRPTLVQILDALGGQPIACKDRLTNRHRRILLGAMTPREAFRRLLNFRPHNLLITPGDRIDLIFTAVAAHARKLLDGEELLSGLILSGDLLPPPEVIEHLEKSGIPTIRVHHDSYRTAEFIHDLDVPIDPSDRKKITFIQNLVEKYVDIQSLRESL